jgi:hypothetical protein
MKYIFFIISSILIIGCSKNNKPLPNNQGIQYEYPDGNSRTDRDYYQNTKRTNSTLNISNKSIIFKKGFKDGCKTGKGYYTKDRNLFKNNFKYNDGWFSGVSHCRN